MPDPTLQQLAIEVRQLRAEVAALVKRFDAQGLPPAPPVNAAPVTDADYDRAVALSRGIISGPPGAGGNGS
jgi:hypothetical protein